MPYAPHIPGNDFGRTCDVCARLRPGKTFRKRGNTWICDYHPSFIPREVLDRNYTYIHPGPPQPIKEAKPFTPAESHEAAEAEVFKYVTETAPTDVWGAAWAALYLYELLAENQRPHTWMSLARTKLATLANYLVSAQTLGTSSAVGYGGFNVSAPGEEYWTADAAVSGLALLRAYQTLGAASYLTGARAAAWFLRTAQCGDKLATGFSSSDAAGTTRIHHGMWTRSISLDVSYDFDHLYRQLDLIGLEFLHAFKAAVGDETIGSPTTTAVFSSSREATLSLAISEARGFWETAKNGVLGFSTATPRERFNSYPASKLGGSLVGTGDWETGNLTALGWALGLRAFRAIDGNSAFVTGVFDWLMTFTSNTSYELPATTANRVVSGYDDRVIYAGVKGTYNPKDAPATALDATNLRNATGLYDLAALGILAPLYSARQRSTFGQVKVSLAMPRRLRKEGSDRDGEYLWLAPLGRCGLSCQPYTDESGGREADLARASMTGLVYRHAPKAFLGRGVDYGD